MIERVKLLMLFMTKRKKIFFLSYFIFFSSLWFFFSFWLTGWAGLGVAILIYCSTLLVFYHFAELLLFNALQARKIEVHQNPLLFQLVSATCLRLRVPTPHLYLVENSLPNLFLIGKTSFDASLILSHSLLSLLSAEELETILIYELSKLQDKTPFWNTMSAALLHCIFFFPTQKEWRHPEWFGIPLPNAQSLWTKFLLIWIAPAVQLLFKISHEAQVFFEYDRRTMLAFQSFGRLKSQEYSSTLARTLQKMERLNFLQNSQLFSPFTAHLNAVNPFSKSSLMVMVQTHPPLEQRIQKILSNPMEKPI